MDRWMQHSILSTAMHTAAAIQTSGKHDDVPQARTLGGLVHWGALSSNLYSAGHNAGLTSECTACCLPCSP